MPAEAPPPKKTTRQLWREAVAPTWEKVPPKMHALFQRVCREASGIESGPNSYMTWPESSLKGDFAECDSALLAGAALVMSLYGLWHPEKTFAEKGVGGWAKFCEYADQTLRVKHGLDDKTTPYEQQYGLNLTILGGLLRVDFDVREKHGWYVYLGIAGDANVKALRAENWPRYPGREEHHADRGFWVKRCTTVADGLAERQRPTKGALALLFDSGAVIGHPAREQEQPKESNDGLAKGAEDRPGVAGGQSRLSDGGGVG